MRRHLYCIGASQGQRRRNPADTSSSFNPRKVMARGRRAAATAEDGAANDPAPAPAPLARRRNARGVAGPTSALTSFLRVSNACQREIHTSADKVRFIRNMAFNPRDPWITAIPPETQTVKKSGTVPQDPHKDRLISRDTRAPASMTMAERMPIEIRNQDLWSRERVRRCTMMIV